MSEPEAIGPAVVEATPEATPEPVVPEDVIVYKRGAATVKKRRKWTNRSAPSKPAPKDIPPSQRKKSKLGHPIKGSQERILTAYTELGMPSLPAESPGMVVGHEVTPAEWELFRLRYLDPEMRVMNNSQFCRTVGIDSMSFYLKRSTLWWKELVDRFWSSAQEQVVMLMAAEAGEIAKAFIDVMKDENPDSKTANARINGFKAFLEAGKDPITRRGRDALQLSATFTENRTVNLTVEDVKRGGRDLITNWLFNKTLPGTDTQKPVMDLIPEPSGDGT